MFQADFFDGLSARAVPVWVKVQDGFLRVDAESGAHTFELSTIEVQAKLGSTRRVVDLPGGARLEASDISELEAVMPSKAALFWKVLHYFENHLGWVLVALFLTIVSGWGFIQHGVPRLAETVAKATPPSMERKLGEQVLKGFDHKYGYFSSTKTENKRQAQIVAKLSDLCAANECPEYDLKFRDGGVIGANAFALPGGIMVVTDDLVKLAKNDTEIVAVLAHELGHVKQRHAFRQSIQSTISGLVLAAVTGDVSSMASGLPAVLVQMQYSRGHELEADGFALKAMQNACLPPKAFAEILFRLQNQPLDADGEVKGKKEAKETTSDTHGPGIDMLSTHPNTIDRIKPFMEAKPTC